MQDTHRDALREIYSRLHSFFGPQGWWPVYSDDGPGYHPGDFSYPRTERQRVEIAIGAILTQQTAWKNVEKALKNLIDHDLMDLGKIMDIPLENLQTLIKSSGYYRQKALRLKEFSSYVLNNHGSLENMFSLDTMDLRKELLSIKGIGKETADSIILYSAKRPMFVVDAYTFRVGERIGFVEKRDYDVLQRLFHESIEPDVSVYNEYHALFVELGKRFCTKNPRCEGCPVSEICAYNKKT
jgi:endonuclease-3 related protein